MLQYSSRSLLIVTCEDEGCPEVGMGEGIYGGLSFDISSTACSVDRIGLFGGEFAGDEVLLDFLEGFGFGEFGLGEGLVELLHEEGGAAVV